MAKTLEQIVNERVQQQIGALYIENARLRAELEVAQEENVALKASTPPPEANGRPH